MTSAFMETFSSLSVSLVFSLSARIKALVSDPPLLSLPKANSSSLQADMHTTHPGPLRLGSKQSPLQSFVYRSKYTATADPNVFMVRGTIMVKSRDGLEKICLYIWQAVLFHDVQSLQR